MQILEKVKNAVTCCVYAHFLAKNFFFQAGWVIYTRFEKKNHLYFYSNHIYNYIEMSKGVLFIHRCILYPAIYDFALNL
jgi:hypothetical protein